jgi:hypothetical protein
MAFKQKTSSEWLFLLTAAIVVAGFVYWHSDLTSDPPMYYSGIGQSLSTDPYMYSFHARNKILFGEANPLNDPRWVVLEKSLVSFCSYLWLSITEISLKEANTVGVLLSVGGLFLLLLGLTVHHRPWVTTAVALCCLINVSLITYGRLPYLENGLIFLSGLTFFLWTRFGERGWGVAAAGITIAAATVTGKAFGALLLPALVLAILISDRAVKWKHVLTAVAAFVAATTMLVLLLYQGHISQAFGFVSHQSVGLHGFPAGLKTPWGFAEHLVGFGYDNHLYSLNPDLFLLLLASGALLSFGVIRNRADLAGLPPTMSFSIFWVLSAWLGIMPLNYSPLRYGLFLIPPIIMLCFITIDHLLGSRRGMVMRSTIGGLAVITALLWCLLFHFSGNFFFFNDPDAPRKLMIWLALPAAFGLALGLRYLVRRIRLFPRSALITLAVGLIGISVVVNSFRVRRKHVVDHSFSVAEANRDLNQILGPNAVITGPYGPTMTFQTEHKSLIHFFGAAQRDPELFDNYPITHVAVDASNRANAIEDFPALAPLQPVANYWIRDYQVGLYDVSGLFDNDEANAYVPSAYEQAIAFYRKTEYDSALQVLSTTPDIINTSKAGGLLFSELMNKKKHYEHVLTMLLALAERYPTDFSLQLECGHFLQKLALMKQDRVLMLKAQKYFEKATNLNPYKADYANILFGETLQNMNGVLNRTK